MTDKEKELIRTIASGLADYSETDRARLMRYTNLILAGRAHLGDVEAVAAADDAKQGKKA